ncbi:Asp23/Gls24 family envelope stress response protein [Gallicola sp. Sow4_E12]|uniref:Asp23/Gls24 family envelope stress response protein n=1 Tax=Gallicola sp. Sow4_E12 TaxID=3438785 RepID=UPI003F8E2482
MKREEFNNGSVRISNDILTLISAIAASEVEGVYSLVGMEGVDMTRVHSNQIKGVALETDGQNILIDIDIIAECEGKVNRIAKIVQENVIDKLKLMTGLDATCVNVQIEGLNC